MHIRQSAPVLPWRQQGKQRVFHCDFTHSVVNVQDTFRIIYEIFSILYGAILNSRTAVLEPRYPVVSYFRLCCTLFQLFPGCSSLFQIVPVWSSVFQLVSSCCSLLEPVSPPLPFVVSVDIGRLLLNAYDLCSDLAMVLIVLKRLLVIWESYSTLRCPCCHI